MMMGRAADICAGQNIQPWIGMRGVNVGRNRELAHGMGHRRNDSDVRHLRRRSNFILIVLATGLYFVHNRANSCMKARGEVENEVAPRVEYALVHAPIAQGSELL
jgi:hypothetical protein